MDYNLNGDIETWVINLASRPDRLASFRRNADEPAGLNAQVFNAIHPAIVDVPKKFRLPAGAYCNGMSHRALWERLLDSNAMHMAIFEDDAVYRGGQMPIEVADLAFDFLFLGGNHTHFGAQQGEHVSGNLYRCKHTLTGHAYIISRRGAQWMIENHDFEATAIDDGWGSLQKEGKSYYLWPSLFVQAPGYSDIWGRNVDYTNIIT